MTLDETPMDPGASHDALAAEYVLGTLDAAERDEAIALIELGPELRGAGAPVGAPAWRASCARGRR